MKNYTLEYSALLNGKRRKVSINVNRVNDDRAKEMIDIWDEINPDEPVLSLKNNTEDKMLYKLENKPA